MKRFFTVVLSSCAAVCMAVDLYLKPEILLTSDTFIAKNRIYHIDGIESPSGKWGKVSRDAMERMIKGKEFKFLYRSKKSSRMAWLCDVPGNDCTEDSPKGKNMSLGKSINSPTEAGNVPKIHKTNMPKVEVLVYHVYFGIFGRDGKPQLNASVQLLKMGLAKYANGCVDKDRGRTYRPAEEYAQKKGLGIWHKK